MVYYPEPNYLLARSEGELLACPLCDRVLYPKDMRRRIMIKEDGTEKLVFRYVCPGSKKGHQPQTVEPIRRKSHHVYKHGRKEGVRKDSHVMTQQELISLIEEIPETKKGHRKQMYQAYFALLYLTGCRVSEILGYEDYEGIKRHQINHTFVAHNGQPYEFLEIKHLPILKTRRKDGIIPPKNVIVPLFIEKRIAQFVIDYIRDMPLNDRLFPFKPNWGLKISQRHIGKVNHYFRHMRATHLVESGIGKNIVQDYIGWQDANSMIPYLHLDTVHISDAMIDKMKREVIE